MSYLNRKMRLFRKNGRDQLEPRRSEARLKTYPSASDLRAWCDVVEDRRRHILELNSKSKAKCMGKFIPIEALLNALMGGLKSGAAEMAQGKTQKGLRPKPIAVSETKSQNQMRDSSDLEYGLFEPKSTSSETKVRFKKNVISADELRNAGIDPASLKPGTFSYKHEGMVNNKITVALKKAPSCETYSVSDRNESGVSVCEKLLNERNILAKELEAMKLELKHYKSLSTGSIPEDFGSDVTLGSEIQELRTKLKDMQSIIEERDNLRGAVQELDQELEKYKNQAQVQSFGDKTQLIDNVLAERDELQRRLDELQDVEGELQELRQKSKRADELEVELKKYSKTGVEADMEVRRSKTKCCSLERELENTRFEREAMERRIQLMKKDHDNCKCLKKENKLLKVERDQLQIKFNELQQIQEEYEELLPQLEQLERIQSERDMYKTQFEDLSHCECEIVALRKELDKYKSINREKKALLDHVEQLEGCICDQEEEIKCLVGDIDALTRNQELTQPQFVKQLVDRMTLDLKRKDLLYSEMEGKYKARIERLESEMVDKNNQIVVLTHNVPPEKCICWPAKNDEADTILLIKKELDAARAENRKLQQIASEMASLASNEHAQTILKQSECAVQKVVSELGKQYMEWDRMRSINTNTRKLAEKPFTELGMIPECQNVGKLKKEMQALRKENEKLQAKLEDEKRSRIELEKKINN